MNAAEFPNLSLALKLAQAGLPVFPCTEAPGLAHDRDGKAKKDKAPYTGAGFKDATTDLAQIQSWWAEWPGAVPGIPTGEASGLSVIDGDLDRDTGAAVGEDQIAELDLAHPDAVKVRTQSGGVQLIYKHVEGARTSSKQVASHIDTRGSGGYIIAPGAKMQSGATYRYEGRTLGQAIKAGDLPAYPVAAVQLAINKRREAKFSDQAKTDIGSGHRDTKATDTETIEVLRTLLAEAPNTLCREDWVKLAVSLRVAYGDTLRDDFTNFSLGYIGSTPCTPQEAALVWRSSHAAHTVTGIGPALSLLKDAVGADRFTAVYREVFESTRDHGGSSFDRINEMFDQAKDPKPAEIKPTAFVLRPPEQIPPRQWLYGKHLIRGFLSLTVAPGGLGKSSMVQVDALAMATGRDLIGSKPPHPLRVWVWNGEDPEDENRRRITAICMHYGLTADDIGDRLHVDSGRVLPIKLATMDKNGPKIARPVSDQLKRAIIANKIDALIIDPFVTTHEVSENDNTAMNAVAAEWRRIADETGCAIDLVHHVSKAASVSGASDDIGIYGARGAGALIDAVRAARYLVRMTDHEANRFGIDGVDQRVTFRVCTDGKANLAPPEAATWRRMVSVSLGNGSSYWPEGDRVGVCTAWTPPDPMEGISVRDLQKVQRAIEASADAPRHNEQSGQWVGYVIADALNMDVGPGIKKQDRTGLQNAARAKIRTMISAWIESGALATDTIEDKRSGRDAKIITVGDPVTEADIHGEVFD